MTSYLIILLCLTLLPEKLSVLHPQGVLHYVSPECLDQDIIIADVRKDDIRVQRLGRITLELLRYIEAHPLLQFIL